MIFLFWNSKPALNFAFNVVKNYQNKLFGVHPKTLLQETICCTQRKPSRVSISGIQPGERSARPWHGHHDFWTENGIQQRANISSSLHWQLRKNPSIFATPSTNSLPETALEGGSTSSCQGDVHAPISQRKDALLIYCFRIFILMTLRTGMLYYCFLMTPSELPWFYASQKTTGPGKYIMWLMILMVKKHPLTRFLAHACSQYFEVYKCSEWVGGSLVTLNAPLGSEMRPRTRSSDKQFITFSLPGKDLGWRFSKQYMLSESRTLSQFSQVSLALSFPKPLPGFGHRPSCLTFFPQGPTVQPLPPELVVPAPRALRRRDRCTWWRSDTPRCSLSPAGWKPFHLTWPDLPAWLGIRFRSKGPTPPHGPRKPPQSHRALYAPGSISCKRHWTVVRDLSNNIYIQTITTLRGKRLLAHILAVYSRIRENSWIMVASSKKRNQLHG